MSQGLSSEQSLRAVTKIACMQGNVSANHVHSLAGCELTALICAVYTCIMEQ